jgi:hypothetical protein
MVSAADRRDGHFTGSVRLARRRLDVTVAVDERTAQTLKSIRAVGPIGRHPRIVFWLAACASVFLVWQRCPTVISHAAFWAEDGWVWYPQCYAKSWGCLLIDHTGYLQTISRLVALLSLLWPLAAAPKVFAFAALVLQAAPAVFLFSLRISPAIPVLGVRLVLALLLVASPGMSEVYVNLTNSQWHLALLAFLILVAAPAVTWPQRIFDTLALVLCGLSGPFAPMLLPVALLWCWRQPGRWQFWRLAITLGTAVAQIVLAVLHRASRGTDAAGVGWSLKRLLNIIDTDILGAAVFGRQAMIDHRWVVGDGWLSNGHLLPTLIAAAIASCALALAAFAAWRGPWVLRAFLIFVGLELVTSLVGGEASGQPIWAALEQAIGIRYFFHPIVAWLAIIVVLSGDRSLALRSIGVALLLLTVTIAIPADWDLPPLPRTAFHDQAKAFAHAPPGTTMIFPIRPMHMHDMVLVKR